MLSDYFNLVATFKEHLGRRSISHQEMQHYRWLTSFGIQEPADHTPLTLQDVQDVPFDKLRERDPLIPFYISTFRMDWDAKHLNDYIHMAHHHSPFSWNEMVPDTATYQRLNRENANVYLNRAIKRNEKNTVIEEIHHDIRLWKSAAMGTEMLKENMRLAYYQASPELMIALFESMTTSGMQRAGNVVHEQFPLGKWIPELPYSVGDYFYNLYADVLSGRRSVKNKDWLLDNSHMPIEFLLNTSIQRGEEHLWTKWLYPKTTISIRTFGELNTSLLPDEWVQLLSTYELSKLHYRMSDTLPDDYPALYATLKKGSLAWKKAIICYFSERPKLVQKEEPMLYAEITTLFDIFGGKNEQAVKAIVFDDKRISNSDEIEVHL